MTSKLERAWWFILPLITIATMLTFYLLECAEIGRPQNIAQWIVYMLSFAAIYRALSLGAWFLVVLSAPTSKLLDGVRPAR